MSWQPLKTQNDCDSLLAAFGGFHDGCLREMHVWTDHSVDSSLSMKVSFKGAKARALFQRQFRDPSAIELLFDEVTSLNLSPPDDNCDAIIMAATLIYKDRSFAFSVEHTIYVSSRLLSWRDASAWMGDEIRFKAENS